MVVKKDKGGNRPQKNDKPNTVNNLVWLLFIVLLTFVVYLPVLSNKFVNWDDQAYIIENPMLRSFNLKDIFSQYQIANYHPVTMLVFTIEYHLFGLNETGYHAVSLLIHLLNTVLVFYLIMHLIAPPPPKGGISAVQSPPLEGRWAAFATALLFGIHPIHVESVAWASELKDLLYTFFFLASAICYLKYLNEKSKKYYLFSLLLFLLSLLSKAMAASLPAVLLLIDYYKGRKVDGKVWIEKLPFIALAIIFGVVAVFAQQSLKAIDVSVYPFPQRIVFACYGFITYLVKIIFPLQLSAYYPYPIKSGESIPAAYYGYVMLVLILLFVVYRLTFGVKRPTPNTEHKTVFFGMAFFAITVFLVLQLLPVGGAVMADRYSYIPSVGIFFLVAMSLTPDPSPKERGGRKALTLGLLAIAVILFSIKTYSQCNVWKNGYTLWNDVIRQHQTITIAYYNRGNLYMNDKKNEEAIRDFTKAVEENPNYARAYSNRANVLTNEGKNEMALRDYNRSIELEPDNYRTYNNRGSVLKKFKKYDEALNDFNKALDIKPDFYEGYNNRGLLLMDEKKYDEASRDFNKAIELQPDFVDAYNNRGLLSMEQKKYDEAIKDFDKAILLQPDFVDGYNNRGYVYYRSNKYDDAFVNYNKAIEINPAYPRAYYNRANMLVSLQRFDEALLDYTKTVELQPDNGEAFFNKAIIEYNTGKKEIACKDLQQSASLGFQTAVNAFRDLCH